MRIYWKAIAAPQVIRATQMPVEEVRCLKLKAPQRAAIEALNTLSNRHHARWQS
jgi:hypothetical protein